jgi:hypothetical protein
MHPCNPFVAETLTRQVFRAHHTPADPGGAEPPLALGLNVILLKMNPAAIASALSALLKVARYL